MLSKVLDFFKAAYMFCIFWLHTTFCFTLLLLVKLSQLFRQLDEDPTCGPHRCCNLWGQGFFFLIPGWSYEITGKEYLPGPGKAYVLVANHQSAADIFALFNLGIQFRWLSKIEVFRLPLVGQAMRLAGYVEVRRGQQGSGKRAMDDSIAWLRKGISMLYFPEGTRSADGKLLPFKAGAFKIAEDEQIEILPLVLRGTRDLLYKGTMTPRKAKIQIKILPPTRKNPSETLEDYASRVREMIHQDLEA